MLLVITFAFTKVDDGKTISTGKKISEWLIAMQWWILIDASYNSVQNRIRNVFNSTTLLNCYDNKEILCNLIKNPKSTLFVPHLSFIFCAKVIKISMNNCQLQYVIKCDPMHYNLGRMYRIEICSTGWKLISNLHPGKKTCNFCLSLM